ncbi:MAG: hypothetical protein R3B48_14170 [Kofleriaceae bacterium]
MSEQAALAALQAMPAWADLEGPDPARAAQILDAAEQLKQLDDDALRRVVVAYVEQERAAHDGLGVSAGSRLYVLVRYVFAAPTRAKGGVARFGSFQGIPTGDGWVDEQWPWSAVDGRLQLTGTFGGYFGEDYLAVEEFDAFRQRYGRRKS